MRTKKALRFSAAFLLLLTSLYSLGITVTSRPLLDDSHGLVSDGLEEKNGSFSSSFNPIRMKGTTSEEDYSERDYCEQMYGFLPCSKTVAGHLFLILVYEYLLFHAESYVASGGERIFKILGPGVFGASVFQIIGSFPEALILLVSGLSSSNEAASEFVLTGVGLLAGSSTLLLTLIWGTCIFLASKDLSPNNQSKIKKPSPLEKFMLRLWPGYGVLTDTATIYTSRIMLISIIPLIIIQFPSIFPAMSFDGERWLVLFTIVVSFVFLLCYFMYQFFQPWIQKRQLLYVKHEHLAVDILKHLRNQTTGELLTDNGSPNISTIQGIFNDKDQDGDKVISFSELKQFLQEINIRNFQSDKNGAVNEMMGIFDIDKDEKITMDEFVRGMMKLLDDTKDAMNRKRFHSVKSLKDMYQILKPWYEKKREEQNMMKHLIPKILECLQQDLYGSLLSDDGTPDIAAIKRLFKDIDLDKDNSVSYYELKELMSKVKFGLIPYDVDVVASKIMEELDISKDQLISEDEFVAGLCKWLDIASNQTPKSHESEEDDDYHKTWDQIDKLVEGKLVNKSKIAWIKALSLLFLGIITLGLLAEPLIHSVRQLSSSINIPSFYVAFVLIPLATSARIAVSAISEAREKKLHTTSLTLSELYSTVFMNNVLGLLVLLCLIYFRGLTWKFSAEVTMVLIVSGIVGAIASSSRVLPVWTSVLAYFLYPLSLVLVYVLGDSTWLS